MKAIHCFKNTKDSAEDALVVLTQLLSVIRFKESNPNIPFCLYTDTETLTQYKEYGIDKVYDYVNTEILDDYPTDRISGHFWASPKLWVMHHMDEPFCVMDTDLVYHKTINDYTGYDYVYLHRESFINYGTPNKIKSSNGFEWTEEELVAFGQVIPVNCAFLIFNNMEFLKTYTTRYFDLVLDNDVEMIMDEIDEYYVHKFAPQIIAEQWLLPAIQEKSRIFEGTRIFSKALAEVIAFPNMFRPFDHDAHEDVAYNELEDLIYHLWGAKDYFRGGKYGEYLKVRDEIYTAILEVLNQNSWFHLNPILQKICRKLPQVPN